MPKGKIKAHVTTWDFYDGESDADSPAFYDWHILAEGDSWFTLGGIPTSNLLFSLQLKKSAIVANCGYPGDTIEHMSKIARNRWYKSALKKGNGYTWEAILISGGGNDLIDKADAIILDAPDRKGKKIKTAGDYCDQVRLANLIADIQAGYRKMAAERDTNGRAAVPIITHTYDYPTPRDAPARFFGVGLLGPWIIEALDASKVPKNDWVAVTDYLFAALAEGILALTKGSDKIKNFHVVDTRDHLKRAALGETGESGDWMNEIHPTGKGYAKIADALAKKLNKLL